MDRDEDYFPRWDLVGDLDTCDLRSATGCQSQLCHSIWVRAPAIFVGFTLG